VGRPDPAPGRPRPRPGPDRPGPTPARPRTGPETKILGIFDHARKASPTSAVVLDRCYDAKETPMTPNGLRTRIFRFSDPAAAPPPRPRPAADFACQCRRPRPRFFPRLPLTGKTVKPDMRVLRATTCLDRPALDPLFFVCRKTLPKHKALQNHAFV
jgi:hypothetical protein